MNVTHIVGVDPGLVHTGVVRLVFRPGDRSIFVEHEAISGPDTDKTSYWIWHSRWMKEPDAIFIEGYRPRSHFNSDARMTAAVNDMKREIGGQVLNNTGVKKVIKPALMELLGVWKFSTVTHHQDLRSAARIALLGMAKDEHLNALLVRVVRDHLEGRTWHVHH